ncbi:hypothetical protein [Nocardia cerradoensis]|uniref:Uncharacterized protein n=1 Tax=Nocardia cerradoensis TaxID=85688 RepID=A0A231HDD9_9NOCA|nr:hypothetical protein [Nocardia cerradoensis]NKY45787.1 hypothetical protein [Nocardia cerradoensis]OXR46889.1 hypothetical protein B7C42_00002 [Nocardia cerradoensis]
MVDVNTDIVSAAEQAVALRKARDGQVLDYSEASLAIVEDLLAEFSSYAADMTDTEVQTLVECFGCWIGVGSQRCGSDRHRLGRSDDGLDSGHPRRHAWVARYRTTGFADRRGR